MQPDFAGIQAQVAQLSGEVAQLQQQLRIHRHDGNYASRVNSNEVFHNTVATPLNGTSGTITFNPEISDVFTVTPSGNITSLKPSTFPNGKIVTLIVKTSGTTSYTITFDVGFTVTGTLSTGTGDGRYFTITFASDGTNLREVSRTAAMLPS